MQICQGIAGLVVIGLSWCNEVFDLSFRLWGGKPGGNWRKAAFETVAVLIVWLALFFVQRKFLRRLCYLEDFLRVCAWCRRIGKDDKWLLPEEYLACNFAIKTSHGMCPDCAARLLAEKLPGPTGGKSEGSGDFIISLPRKSRHIQEHARGEKR